jgi:C4-dicarboxylate-specific signal transduction histidine kinase
MNEQPPEHTQNLHERIMEVFRTLLHDLNNTAFAIDYNAVSIDRLLKNPVLDRHELQRFSSGATRASGHLIDLLKYAQSALRHGEASYHPRPTNLTECVDTASEIYGRILAKHNIKVTKPKIRDVQTAGRLYFNGDSVRMVQVLLNLFSNSANALEGQEKREISLSIDTILSGEHDAAVLTVRNNGPRMPYANPNEAKEKGKTTKDGSQGLGLYICTDIIEGRFGGNFEITHPQECGVAFHIHLRLCTPEEIKNYANTVPGQPYQP